MAWKSFVIRQKETRERTVTSGTVTRQAIIIVSPKELLEKNGRTIAAVNGAAYLASPNGRRCPSCGQSALIGHGGRARGYQWEPVRRGKPRPRCEVYRVRCNACRKMHTVLPPELGPYKRYVLLVIERGVKELSRGRAAARVSAVLGGISPERLVSWKGQFDAVFDAVRRHAEALVTKAPLFHLPAVPPTADVFTYLESLLNLPAGLFCLFVAINVLFSQNPSRQGPLLLHPPASNRPIFHAYPSHPHGGDEFG